jgi:hypothetical protein
MYLIIDKTSRTILHMSNSVPNEDKKPQELLPGFDPKTMVFGRSPEQFIPGRFDIEDGVVVDLDPPPAVVPALAETLEQARARKKQEFTGQALALRASILPDYQLLNAGLGLYDDARANNIRLTVNAFRSEMTRLEALIDKARTVKDVDALVAAFPTTMINVTPAAPAKSLAKAKTPNR